MNSWYSDAPTIPPKPWMKDKRMELVTAETIHGVVDRCIASGRYAHDLETTGLDTRVFDSRTRDHIVGHCLSPDGKSGYYIPVRHLKGAHQNLSITLVEEEMRRLGESDSVAVFFNAAFDQEFLAYPGGQPMGSRWDDPAKWEDMALHAYLFNPRDKNRNLKDLSRTHLGMEMIELEQLFPPGHKGKLSFAELDPSDDAVLWYACSDAICTYELYGFLHPRIQDQPGALLIEKLCLPATRWMERNRIKIDTAKVAELIQLGQEEYFDALVAVYDACEGKLGRSIAPSWMTLLRNNFDRSDPNFDILEQIDDFRKMAKLRRGLEEEQNDGAQVRKAINGVLESFPPVYDVLSRPQLGRLLQELEVPGLTLTEKSGQVDTTADVINQLAKEYGHAYPFLPLFSRMGELQKALSTYLTSLRDDVGPDGTIRFRFRQTGTDTGRFTTPQSKHPSEDGGTKFPLHGTPATYDKTRPKCLLRIREAIVARPGAVLVACFAEGSLVTTGRGLLPIEQVRIGDTALTDQGFKPVANARKTGTKPTVTVRTQKGFEIRVTPDHPLRVVAGSEGYRWKAAGDLQPGDWVVQLAGTPEGILAEIPGVPWSDCHQLSVPPCIMRGSGEITAAFLRGLFDADGSVGSRSGDGVSVWISSTQMALEVQLLLLQHGIQAKRTWGEFTTNFGPATGWSLTISGIRFLERFHERIGMACMRKKLQLEALMSAGRNRDISEVFPLALAKLAVFSQREAASNGKRKGRVSRQLLESARRLASRDVDETWMQELLDGPLMFDQVAEVSESGMVDVYDVTVPATGSLLVNGIYSKQCDFSGVELRIATNLSGEPKWFREFFRCSTCSMEFDRGNGDETPEPPPPYCPGCGSDRIGDLHTLTSLVFYGEERTKSKKEGKDLRQKSKTANFALVYGGGPKALQAATGCDDNEAARQFDGFGKMYDVLGHWWLKVRAFGTRMGFVQTAFGRKYPAPDLQLAVDGKSCPDPFKRRENKNLKSKAERNATNSPIQGSSADITKLGMGKIYQECKKRGWLDKVRMIITMHDELVFDVDLDVLAEAVQILPHIMTRNKGILSLKWKVPLTSDVELGYDYTVPWNLKNFIARRVRRDGVEVDFHGNSVDVVWPQAFLDAFGPVYGFADDVDAPKPVAKVEASKSQALVHRLEFEELNTDLIGHLARLLVRVKGTGKHRLEVRLKNGTNLLWPGAAIFVDPALCLIES